MRFADLAAASRAVAGTSRRLEKIDRLADLLKRTPADEIEIVVAYLSGEPRQGRLGIGWAQLASMRDVPPAQASSLEIRTVDATFDRVAATAGARSAEGRARLLRELLGYATHDEQDLLLRLLVGELRHGALEGVLLEAIARASGVPTVRVRRATMLAGDLGIVARTAIIEGDEALSRFILQPFKPVQPMLAGSAADVADALSNLGEASFEYKLDGARIQAHKKDDEVRVFSRNLRDVTVAVPEVVNVVRAMPARDVVLDGEAIVLRPDGTPQPFQVTMRRFGRKLDVDHLKETLTISPFFFDALYVDGEALVDEPLTGRIERLNRIVVPRQSRAADRDVECQRRGGVRRAGTGVRT